MTANPECLYCKQTSDDIPLIEIIYRDEPYWICPQHFPLMIHDPAKLIGKIPGLDQWTTVEEPDHHH
jgi:hypothetical protein